MSQAAVGQRSAHRPQWTQRSSSFTMSAPGLRQRRGRVDGLIEIDGRRREALAQFVFVAVARDGQALHRTDVDAGVALDAALRR